MSQGVRVDLGVLADEATADLAPYLALSANRVARECP